MALPIAKARLKVGDRDETKIVVATDKAAVFNVPLKAGTKLPMQS
jgi:hypothetical protein